METKIKGYKSMAERKGFAPPILSAIFFEYIWHSPFIITYLLHILFCKRNDMQFGNKKELEKILQDKRGIHKDASTKKLCLEFYPKKSGFIIAIAKIINYIRLI